MKCKNRFRRVILNDCPFVIKRYILVGEMEENEHKRQDCTYSVDLIDRFCVSIGFFNIFQMSYLFH